MLEWLEVWLDVGCNKNSCASTALNRWNATAEMRWNKNAVSSASPIAALNRRPTSVRKSKEQEAIAPRVSRAICTERNIIIIIINAILNVI